jgi:outer membrane protein
VTLSPTTFFCIFSNEAAIKIRNTMRKSLPFVLFACGPALWAQDSLTVRDAVRLALGHNQAVAASGAALAASASRVDQAHGGWLPKLNYAQSYTRSDNPVFVFSSLLTQHQFGPENFNIGPLNRPDSINNFQSQLTVDQVLYDAGQVRNAVKSADLGREMSGEEQRRTRMQVISGVAKAYYGAVLAAESLKTAEQAQRSAEADLKRADSVRAAGMSTDVDVLSIRVHLAAVNEQRIQRAADLDVARAALNDVLGLPLDTPHTLTTALSPLDLPDMELAALEHDAATGRPEARETRLAADLAKTQVDSARSSFLPQVSFHAGFETNAQNFVTKGGTNWLASVGLRWNLFNGFADRAHVAESKSWLERAHADQHLMDSAVRLEVRRAWANLRAAEQRIEVAKAAVAEAEESLRITQNRYEAGMSNVTDLLRNETAVLESRTRFLAAVHDQRIAATMLDLAAGRLTPDSEVLN